MTDARSSAWPSGGRCRGALFQCALPISWDPVPLLDVLALSNQQRATGARQLAEVAEGLGEKDAAAAGAALVAGLP